MQGVVWITGLSGAGKSTVAGLVRRRLGKLGVRSVLLDGDRMRSIIPFDLGYREADRLLLAGFYARLAKEIAEQGNMVVCSTISLFHQVHEWNRANIVNYVETWLRVPADELRSRGRTARRDTVGANIRAEFPTRPDLVIDNYGSTTADQAGDTIVRTLLAVHRR